MSPPDYSQPCGKHDTRWCADCGYVAGKGLSSLDETMVRFADGSQVTVSGPAAEAVRPRGPVSAGRGYVQYDEGGYLPANLSQARNTSGEAERVLKPSWDQLAETAYRPRLIESEYHGTCRACGGRWEPGDQIGWSDDEDAWCCAGCLLAE